MRFGNSILSSMQAGAKYVCLVAQVMAEPGTLIEPEAINFQTRQSNSPTCLPQKLR